MYRRQFLGTVAVTCLVTGGVRPAWSQDLDWTCEPIQMPAASVKKRAPVVTGVCLSPSESQLAVVGDDHLVHLYDLPSRRFRPALSAHRDWVRSVAFTPDGSQLVTAGNDRLVLLWNTQTWEQPLMLAQQPQAAFAVACSPTQPLLATVGFSSTLFLYDLADKQETLKLECPCDDMRAVAFSKEGRWLAAGGRNGTIRVWEVGTGQAVAEYAAHRQRIRSLQFNAEGQLLSCGDDQVVRWSDPLNPSNSKQLPRQSGKLFAVTLLDGPHCATAGSDNLISIWSLDSGELQGTLRGHTGTISCLCLGTTLLVSGSYDTQIRLWNRQVQTEGPRPRQTNSEPGWNLRLK